MIGKDCSNFAHTRVDRIRLLLGSVRGSTTLVAPKGGEYAICVRLIWQAMVFYEQRARLDPSSSSEIQPMCDILDAQTAEKVELCTFSVTSHE